MNPEFDIEKYYGKWYQIYSNIIIQELFERGSRCIQALYEPLEDNKIRVYNQQITSQNEIESIEGFAIIPNPKEPFHLEVYFPSVGQQGAPYWIYDLGPIENGQYQYAIVSDPKQRTLYVLARDVDDFMERYDKIVLQTLQEMGFTKSFNEPLLTNQDDCFLP